MHPAHSDHYNAQRLERDGRGQFSLEQLPTQSTSSARRLRPEDSWIDIASQPSVSLYSQNDNDIITTGLDVRASGRQLVLNSNPPAVRSNSVAGSSQDEYDESESDSDRVMSSSNEDIPQQVEDEDETATALGVGQRNVFTPQPNAFSHPPTSGNIRSAPAPGSYFPPVSRPSHSDRLPSNRMITQQTISQRPRRDQASSSRVRPDHDAALRASLTTLLSCAAAVRPSKDQEVIPAFQCPSQPTALRLIPESELDAPRRSQKSVAKRRSRELSKERQAKKIRASKVQSANEEVVSPTITTWMISAGVVLVFSAISFSAGYAWGKEIGKFEGEMGIRYGNCGQDTLRSAGSLRKLRWGAAAQSIRA